MTPTTKKRKPYKQQEDRLLRRMSQQERRYQKYLRTLIASQDLDYLAVS